MGDGNFHLAFSLPTFYLGHGCWMGKAGIPLPMAPSSQALLAPILCIDCNWFFSRNQKGKKASQNHWIKEARPFLSFTWWHFPCLSLTGFQVILIQPEGLRLLCHSSSLLPPLQPDQLCDSCCLLLLKPAVPHGSGMTKVMLSLHTKIHIPMAWNSLPGPSRTLGPTGTDSEMDSAAERPSEISIAASASRSSM